MQKIIRLGDATSHGGKVVSATSHMTVGGLPIARLGDKCTCPKRGHNNCVIVEGDTAWTIDGIPVALEGHKTSCGAVLISSAPNAGREEWGADAGNAAATGASSLNNGSALPFQTAQFDEQVRLQIQDNPGSGVPYYVETTDGRSFSGYTSTDGKLPRIATTDEEEYVVYFYDEALSHMDKGDVMR